MMTSNLLIRTYGYNRQHIEGCFYNISTNYIARFFYFFSMKDKLKFLTSVRTIWDKRLNFRKSSCSIISKQKKI